MHLAAWLLKKPVKVLLSREESLMVHPKRHGMEMDFTTGCDEEGNLTAMKAVIYADTGAYASLGGPVLQRACTHAAGPTSIKRLMWKGLLYILIIRQQVHFVDLVFAKRLLQLKVI